MKPRIGLWTKCFRSKSVYRILSMGPGCTTVLLPKSINVHDEVVVAAVAVAKALAARKVIGRRNPNLFTHAWWEYLHASTDVSLQVRINRKLASILLRCNIGTLRRHLHSSATIMETITMTSQFTVMV